eukprot:3503781-Rhodomonas_salina.1
MTGTRITMKFNNIGKLPLPTPVAWARLSQSQRQVGHCHTAVLRCASAGDYCGIQPEALALPERASVAITPVQYLGSSTQYVA